MEITSFPINDDNDPIIQVETRTRRSPNRDDSDSDDSLKSHTHRTAFDPLVDLTYLKSGFTIGFAEDRNKRFRRTMEDAHTICTDFDGVEASGFFAVFDGHAGRAAADYAGEMLHKVTF